MEKKEQKTREHKSAKKKEVRGGDARILYSIIYVHNMLKLSISAVAVVVVLLSFKCDWVMTTKVVAARTSMFVANWTMTILCTHERNENTRNRILDMFDNSCSSKPQRIARLLRVYWYVPNIIEKKSKR